jgi:hypothetical protein
MSETKKSNAKVKRQFQGLYELFGVELIISGNNGRAPECPFCGRDRFYVNVENGTYKCHSENNCGSQGNAYTFIRWWHREFLRSTTDEQYRRLTKDRGLPLQTLKRHELAWAEGMDCWLIPYKSPKGEVLNLLRYYPNNKKWLLPGLPIYLYGVDQLAPEEERSSRTLFVVEGAWDAIALDQHLIAKKSRSRYDILAVHSANVFRKDWLKHFAGYKSVRLCLDNDKAGREGQDRIVKMAREEKIDCKIFALKWPDVSPDKCDIRDLTRSAVNVVEFTKENCLKVTAGEGRILFLPGDAIPEEKVVWLWEGHIPFATFVSLSGLMGTHKSLIARFIAAMATAGKPMPHCQKAVDPFTVLYFTSEDSAARVRDLVRIHSGDLTRLFVHDIISVSEPIDILDCLEEMEAEINARQARLVILDALNSFVGGDISSDAKARRTLSGRLQALARKTGACIIGIRNWGRMESGSASQKALGATSLSDVARCVMNTQELPPLDSNDKSAMRRFQLEFEKVSDAPKPKPLGYEVVNKSTGPADSHLRKIVWAIDAEAFAAKVKANRKKGSAKR